MDYSHLTAGERYQIYILRRKQCSVTEIAELIQRNKGTVSRELRRNCGERGYRPKQAQEKSETRCRTVNALNARKVPEATRDIAKRLILQDYSPEQVSGRLGRTREGDISHETVYQLIYEDKANGGKLHIHLRSQKKRRKRYGSGQQRRGTIRDRVGIEHRPASVEKRARVGHWEMDSVVGCNHKGFLVTMVERKSRITFSAPVARKTAALVASAISNKLRRMKALVSTITFDNGKEFAFHKKIAKRLGCKAYFATPFRSCERGTNENTNGLYRQYLPKKTSFENLTYHQTQIIDDRLNNRPRKCLDYETPLEVFTRSAKGRGVALRL